MIKPIPEDATEVIYHPYYGRTPYLVKVVKHTPTTVQIEGFADKFRRKDGFQQGAGITKGSIHSVTPEGLDRIEAAKLYPQVEVLQREIRAAANTQLNKRIEAAKKGMPEYNTADCTATIEALKLVLEAYTGD